MSVTKLAYLLIGQSNMFGVAGWPLPDPLDPYLLMLNPTMAAFAPAMEPLHGWVHPNPALAGSGPGKAFGLRLRQRVPYQEIVLLAAAQPSTIAGLARGTAHYAQAVDLMQQAVSLGATPGGIVCHHGEADTSDVSRAEAWDGELIRFVTHYREDVGAPTLPIAFSQLGLCSLDNPPAYTWDLLKYHQSLVTPARLPNSKMVRTDDFFDLTFDRLHSSAANNNDEGRRLADAMLTLSHAAITPGYRPTPLTSQVAGETQAVRTTTFMVKVEVGQLVNCTARVNGQAVASGGTYVVQPPYGPTIDVAATRIGPGLWHAPFTVHDAVFADRFVLGRGGQQT